MRRQMSKAEELRLRDKRELLANLLLLAQDLGISDVILSYELQVRGGTIYKWRMNEMTPRYIDEALRKTMDVVYRKLDRMTEMWNELVEDYEDLIGGPYDKNDLGNTGE